MARKTNSKNQRPKPALRADEPESTRFNDSQIKILQAYLHLATTNGVVNVTLQTLADKSGLAIATVRNNFGAPGTPEIADATAVYVVQNGQNRVEKQMYRDRHEKDFNPFESYINATFHWLTSQPKEAAFLGYFYYLSAIGKVKFVSADEMWQRARIRITGLLHESVGLGLYSLPDEVDLVVNEIHSLVVGACLVSGTSRSAAEWKRQHTLVLRALNRLLKS